MSDIEINIENSIIRGITEEFVSNFRKKLLNGEYVYLEGIGTFRPKYRSVRNSYGKEYSVRIVLDPDIEFSNKLYENYTINPEKYMKGRKKHVR